MKTENNIKFHLLSSSMNSLNKTKKILCPILKRHGVIKAGIFGSVARGTETRKSDIDILVKFKGRKSLIDLASLELDLEDNLKKKVDVLTYNSIHPLLKDRIKREEVKII